MKFRIFSVRPPHEASPDSVLGRVEVGIEWEYLDGPLKVTRNYKRGDSDEWREAVVAQFTGQMQIQIHGQVKRSQRGEVYFSTDVDLRWESCLEIGRIALERIEAIQRDQAGRSAQMSEEERQQFAQATREQQQVKAARKAS